ncbi:MAG: Crp/Fnr family transcriptional regulator [Bacteroidota bacterium]
MFDILFAYIEEFLPMPEENRQQCRDHFEPAFFPKGTIIQQAGTVPQYHNFIASGCLRNYFVDQRGQEITTDLNDGPRFFTSYEHFMAQTVSPETIVSLTDCEMLQVSRQNVEVLMGVGGHVIREFSMLVMQRAWEEEKQRLHERASLTAEQRYLKFMEKHPRLMKQIPLQYIASYLGLQPESLSRIRRKLIS